MNHPPFCLVVFCSKEMTSVSCTEALERKELAGLVGGCLPAFSQYNAKYHHPTIIAGVFHKYNTKYHTNAIVAGVFRYFVKTIQYKISSAHHSTGGLLAFWQGHHRLKHPVLTPRLTSHATRKTHEIIGNFEEATSS